MLAPFDTNEDFSTNSIMRDKGDSLTTEKLARLDLDQIVEEIVVKAGVVNFSRVYRIVCDVSVVKKLR